MTLTEFETLTVDQIEVTYNEVDDLTWMTLHMKDGARCKVMLPDALWSQFKKNVGKSV